MKDTKSKALILSLFMILSLFGILAQNVVVTNAEEKQELKRILLVYAPGLELNELRELLGNNSKAILGNDSAVYIVKTMPPYSSLYYELSIIGGRLWDLSKGLPLNRNKLNVSGKIVEAWTLINQTEINLLWSSGNTSFIELHGVSPRDLPRVVNTDANVSDNIVIPPTEFLVQVNESLHWDLVNKSMVLKIENETLYIEIEGGIKSEVRDNETSVLTLDVTDSMKLEPGKYDIVFKVAQYNSTHYKLFTVGTMKRGHGFSEDIMGFTKPVIPHIPSLDGYDRDTKLWIISEVAEYYVSVVSYVVSEKKQPITLVNYPLIEEVKRMKKSLNDIYEEALRTVYQGLYKLVDKALDELGEDNTILYVFSPYGISENGTDLSKVLGLEVEYVLPGIIRYDERVVSKLIEEDIDFRILNIRGEKYIGITEPEYVPADDRLFYDNGVFISKPSIITGNYTANISVILGYLFGLSNIYGAGFANILNTIHELHVEVARLKLNISSLNATITDLENKLDDMTKKYGEVNAEKMNLTARINELEKALAEEREKVNTLYLYSTAGIGSIIVITLLYVVVIRSVAKRRR